jgi:hypothetical protein
MYKYDYPLITGGYRFNVGLRCQDEVGVFPNQIYDSFLNGEKRTFLVFQNEISGTVSGVPVTGAGVLSGLMTTGNPSYPPTPSGTTFVIEDLYEKFEEFKANAGIELKLYYTETTPGSGEIDKLELQADRILTNPEKNSLRGLYADLITEVTV